MKYIIAFCSFHHWQGVQNMPWYSQFDETGLRDVQNMNEIVEILNQYKVLWTFQMITLLYIRVMIKEGLLDKNMIELRIYSNKDKYEVVDIDYRGELRHYPNQLDTHSNLYFRLI